MTRPTSKQDPDDAWLPIFGWVTREEFDRVLPQFSASRSGVRYEYGAAADERRAVHAWAKGIRDGCNLALVARLIRRWVEGTDEFRAKAFR